MPQVVQNFPEVDRIPRVITGLKRHQALFERVSDGQVWKILRGEFFPTEPNPFRNHFSQWCRYRNWLASTSVDSVNGDVYVVVNRNPEF